MIRKSLRIVQEATFCIELPSEEDYGMPTPTGTGFFISPDGWLVTAAHVISKNGATDGEPRDDMNNAWLMKESKTAGPGAMCQFISLVSVEHIIPQLDFAILKVDFAKNSNKEWLRNRTDFPYIQVSTRQLEMGEPVYSFGYPLSYARAQKLGHAIIGTSSLSPRVTSAIVASDFDKTKMVMSDADPKYYVLDKALNYGNSGGPIVSTDTGHVHALCSRFQPVNVPQPHLKDSQGSLLHIMIPSLYGVVSSLSNKPIIDLLTKLNVPLTNE
jgi:hypothetical protein